MKIHWRRGLVAAVAAAFFATGAHAQDSQQPNPSQRGQRGQFAGMQRVSGEVTAVNGSSLTIKGEDGVFQVTVTDNTRIMKGRGETVKVADIKVGDGLMAAGNLDAPNKTMHAAMVVATDAAALKAFKDNLGKTYITGKVTAIDVDNAKMTIERPDKVSQTITFDETTSFKRGRGMSFGAFGAGMGRSTTPQAEAAANAGESITLADIKVGDNVSGQGALKSGTFVPTQLMVATPGEHQGEHQGARHNGAGSPPPANPGATPPQQ